jgi:spore germination protein KC
MRRGKVLLLAALCLVLAVTAGCGPVQINELAIVTAVGLDIGEEEGSYRISAQIVRSADARGQTGAPSGGTGEPIYSIAAEGKTIFEAIRNLARFSSRRVYWAHNFVIVINEKLAKRGIGDIVDFFTRNPELRMNTWVVVTSNSAGEVVSTVTGLEVVPGQAIDKLFRYNRIVGEAPSTNMMRLFEVYMSKTSHPVLARVELKNRGISNKKPMEFGSLKQVELSGAAVFRRDKMVGWLNSEETKGLLMFIESVDSSIVSVSCPRNPAERATLEVNKQQVRVIPGLKDGKPRFDVHVKATASLVETGCSVGFSAMKDELEAELQKKVKSQLEAVLDKAQHKYRVDFLKLGQVFNNKYPKQWREFEGRWEEVLADSEVDITLDIKITSQELKVDGKGTEGDDE